MYRTIDGAVQVLLAHPGGPYFVNKDEGAWSIPKGEPDSGESLLITAQREFEEETGLKPTGPFIPLQSVKQKGGKIVHAWAFEGDCDPATLRSNMFTIEWPPKSGVIARSCSSDANSRRKSNRFFPTYFADTPSASSRPGGGTTSDSGSDGKSSSIKSPRRRTVCIHVVGVTRQVGK